MPLQVGKFISYTVNTRTMVAYKYFYSFIQILFKSSTTIILFAESIQSRTARSTRSPSRISPSRIDANSCGNNIMLRFKKHKLAKNQIRREYVSGSLFAAVLQAGFTPIVSTLAGIPLILVMPVLVETSMSHASDTSIVTIMAWSSRSGSISVARSWMRLFKVSNVKKGPQTWHSKNS